MLCYIESMQTVMNCKFHRKPWWSFTCSILGTFTRPSITITNVQGDDDGDYHFIAFQGVFSGHVHSAWHRNKLKTLSPLSARNVNPYSLSITVYIHYDSFNVIYISVHQQMAIPEGIRWNTSNQHSLT